MLAPSTVAAFPFTTPSPIVGQGFGNIGGLGFLLFIVAIVVVRRIKYATHGRRFSRGRVISLPAIYLFLTLVTIIPLEYLYPEAMLSLLTIPVGFAAGYMFGKHVSFFDRGGVLYFKRSPVVLILWLVSYITRIFLYYLLGTNFQVAFIVDAILALTSGLLLGESIRVIRGHSQYIGKPSSEPEDFELMKEL